MDGVTMMQKKKTMGRRKIPIRKIEKPSSLLVTFSKRRKGLFKKASELSLLCGAQIAMLVQSPAHKIYSFGAPSCSHVETMIRKFEEEEEECSGSESRRIGYGEELMEKEEEGYWWDMEIDEDVMQLKQLEEYAAAMDGLRENVVRRIQGLENARMMMATRTSFDSEMGTTDVHNTILQQQKKKQDCNFEMETSSIEDGSKIWLL